MAFTLHDIFTPETVIDTLDGQEAAKRENYLRAVRAFARTSYQPVFVADFHSQEFLYISGNMQYLCGISGKNFDVTERWRYFDFVLEEEEEMLKETLDKARELFYSFPAEERADWTLSYYFHLKRFPGKRIIQHRVTPLKLTPDGRLWLAMCVISMSSRRESGHVTMRRYGHQDYFFYSFKNHVWYYREGISLTDTERDLLMLSSQGYTVKEIAMQFNKSEDTIKSYKRALFSKLGVRNITEAVFNAINEDLFH